MATVHIRIRHEDDFMIAKFGNIKVISKALGKTATEGINHGLDFRIGQHLID